MLDLILELEEKYQGQDRTLVMISDNLLASIMGVDIGTYSFDFVVEKLGNIITFDIRKDSDIVPEQQYKENFLDLQYVGETSTTDPPPA